MRRRTQAPVGKEVGVRLWVAVEGKVVAEIAGCSLPKTSVVVVVLMLLLLLLGEEVVVVVVGPRQSTRARLLKKFWRAWA